MTSQITLSSCIDSPLNPQLWASLAMDQYLKNYPGGMNMTLTQYTRNVHAANFVCGLGRHCTAGQPCAPVAKLDWLVLFSVQQWNFYMNILYEAIETAISVVRDVAAAAITDFTPVAIVKWMGLTISTGVLASIVLVTASALMIVGPTPFTLLSDVAIEGAAEAVAAEGAASAAAGGTAESVASGAAAESGVAAKSGATAVAAGGRPTLVRRHHKETLSTDRFAAYARLDNDITVLHAKLNRVIFLNVNAVLNSPISSDLGVYNVVKNGTYMTENPSKADVQASARQVAQLTMLSELFKSLRMFVLLGNMPCTQNGPNGALAGDDVLSYCNEESLMMNIVRADGDHLVERIPHAKLLESKYGFHTKYLITTAWSCQQKAINSTVAETANRMNSDCAFTLPVCDTRLPDIRKRIEAHVDIVVACREGANLSI